MDMHLHVFGRTVKIIGTVVIAVVLVLSVYGYYVYTSPVKLGESTVTVIVKQGDTFGRIADELAGQHAVHSRAMLWYAALWSGVDRRLVPGRYDFTGDVSVNSIIQKFLDADIVMVRVTIPEGSTLLQTMAMLSEKLELDSTELVSLNTDPDFLERLNLPYLEGRLFPDTYDFPWGIDSRSAVNLLVRNFRATVDTVWPTLIVDGLSRQEVLILASIVEAETNLGKERPMVASVYLNRLRKGMRLDADPTVSYGLYGVPRPLSRRDLRTETPFNTYMKTGLPPTPINSPGLKAIQAVLHPANTDYLFFVANNGGGHYFSRTNDEHNIARMRVRAERALMHTLVPEGGADDSAADSVTTN